MLALLAANAFPLAGVFLFRWEVFPLLLLFWSENVIVGIFNALKMLCAAPSQGLQWAMKCFFIPFFCFHYGLFTFVHGIFVVILFGGGLRDRMSAPSLQMFLDALRGNHLGWAVFGLFASHAVAFTHNYLLGGEFRRTDVTQLMMQPYGRIIVLHLTVLLGGFLMMALKSPVLGLVLLVILKTGLDLRAHLNERAKFKSRRDTDETTTSA